MGRKAKYSEEFKLEVVREYLSGVGSTDLERKYGCNKTDVYKWINKYNTHGTKALCNTQKNQSYSAEFKLMVVHEYLIGNIGLLPLATKYEIKSKTQILEWVKRYNGHEGNLKAYKANGGIAMTNGRKTTFEERIEIVEYCLKNGENYSITADKFKVSYNQIYSWVNKYKKEGVAALKDNRGRGKALEDMDNLERLEAENKLLRAKIASLEMEADLKKKLKDVQMRLEYNIRNKK